MNHPNMPGSSDSNSLNPSKVLTYTDDMFIPHSIFRGEFHLAPEAVRASATGDTARANVVAGHLHFLVDTLRHHHENEDELLWPRLHERVPVDVEPVVDLMENHHEQAHHLIEKLNQQLDDWVSDATEGHREALADTLGATYELLEVHLDAEEREILPLAARAISQAEWDEIGERGLAEIPRNRRMFALGSIRYWAPAEQSTAVVSDIPAPLRPAMRVLSDRAFRNESLRIFGTAHP